MRITPELESQIELQAEEYALNILSVWRAFVDQDIVTLQEKLTTDPEAKIELSIQKLDDPDLSQPVFYYYLKMTEDQSVAPFRCNAVDGPAPEDFFWEVGLDKDGKIVERDAFGDEDAMPAVALELAVKSLLTDYFMHV